VRAVSLPEAGHQYYNATMLRYSAHYARFHRILDGRFPMTSPIPQTFDECGIPLTPDFVQERLGILGDPGNAETQRFVRLYGEIHWQRVLSWFGTALEHMSFNA
jgi:hypothetical protein